MKTLHSTDNDVQKLCRYCYHCRIWVVRLESPLPQSMNFSQFYAVFFWKFWQNYMLASPPPFEGSRPPPRGNPGSAPANYGFNGNQWECYTRKSFVAVTCTVWICLETTRTSFAFSFALYKRTFKASSHWAGAIVIQTSVHVARKLYSCH